MRPVARELEVHLLILCSNLIFAIVASGQALTGQAILRSLGGLARERRRDGERGGRVAPATARGSGVVRGARRGSEISQACRPRPGYAQTPPSKLRPCLGARARRLPLACNHRPGARRGRIRPSELHRRRCGERAGAERVPRGRHSLPGQPDQADDALPRLRGAARPPDQLRDAHPDDLRGGLGRAGEARPAAGSHHQRAGRDPRHGDALGERCRNRARPVSRRRQHPPLRRDDDAARPCAGDGEYHLPQPLGPAGPGPGDHRPGYCDPGAAADHRFPGPVPTGSARGASSSTAAGS